MRTHLLLIILFSFTASMGMARDYIIYSIIQDIPMGYENEQVKKNFYVNIGSKQGVQEGTRLDVFRSQSVQDQYKNKKRYNHNIKVGELEILHTEEENAIGILKSLNTGTKAPYFEVGKFMIGDRVDIHINK